MTGFTRRDVLGSTVGATTLLAGCSESSSSGSFSKTAVEDQQLVVEFEESLEAETISVVDPDGESFAETEVSAGVSRVTFNIGMPYTPGEYVIVAADGDDTVAEATQEIRPKLEIVDVGVGANRMDEMPEELGGRREVEALVKVRNSGTGPELISQLQFQGDLPNPRDLADERIGIFNPELPGEARNPLLLGSEGEMKLFSSTLPFTFEGDGVDCDAELQTGMISIELRGEILGVSSAEYNVEYSASESYRGCDITVEGTE